MTTDGADAAETLREVDAELAARIEQLEHARAEIAEVLGTDAPVDVPAGFASVAEHLYEADRSIIHIYTRLYDEGALADLRHMVEQDVEAGD